MSKKCLLIQPGAFGDIIVCLPIAYHYHTLDYEVIWPVAPKFMGIFRNINYVTPAEIMQNPPEGIYMSGDWLRDDYNRIRDQFLNSWPVNSQYEIVLNLCDRDWPRQQRPDESFEEYKYRKALVSISNKNHLMWDRDLRMEKRIFSMVQGRMPNETEYAYVINTTGTSDPKFTPNTNLPVVEHELYDGHNIFDYYLALVNASEIHTSESAFAQLIEGDYNFPQDIKLKLYPRRGQYWDTRLTKKWEKQ